MYRHRIPYGSRIAEYDLPIVLVFIGIRIADDVIGRKSRLCFSHDLTTFTLNIINFLDDFFHNFCTK